MNENWFKTSLGELESNSQAGIQTGPFGTVLKASEYSSVGSPVISVGEIRYGSIQISEHTPLISDEIKKRLPQFILKTGDIVFGRKGGIDRNSIVNKNQNGWFLGSDGIRLRLAEGIDSLFVSYQLQYPSIGKWLLQNSSGSVMPSLNQKTLNRLPIWLPEYKEQRQISWVLSSIDNKIEINNKINAELEAMAKLIFDYWFVQFDFPDANGKPYKASGGKMVFNEVLNREIPEGWKDKELSQVANITMGQSPNGSSYNSEGKGMMFFQGSTDFGYRFPSVRKYTTEPRRLAKQGDVLLSVRAPVGTLNIADDNCCIGRGLAALNSKHNADSFLFYAMLYFKQVFDRRDSSGTTFGSITKDDLFSLKLVYPSFETLHEYDKKVSEFNIKILNNHQQNKELSKLRDWLLPMLMNGQVTVKASQANDS